MPKLSDFEAFLPDWVQQDLNRHALDKRPAPGTSSLGPNGTCLGSHEPLAFFDAGPYLPMDLAYGRTHDRLYNALARCLRTSGVLHVDLVNYYLHAVILMSTDWHDALQFCIVQLHEHSLSGGGRCESAPDLIPMVLIRGLFMLYRRPPEKAVDCAVVGRIECVNGNNLKKNLGSDAFTALLKVNDAS